MSGMAYIVIAVFVVLLIVWLIFNRKSDRED